MATYVISDIHGRYDKFIELLDLIDFTDEDTIYILGDVLDRGPNPIKALLKIMDMKNAVFIRGNHEEMAMRCLPTILEEITEFSIFSFDDTYMQDYMLWQMNGCQTTLNEFYDLDTESKQKVIDFIDKSLYYKELTVNNTNYLLVHAGLGNFSPDKPIENYNAFDLVWERADYEKQYFEDKILITGHTPTQTIDCCDNPGFIFRNKNHIAIDCGACFLSGRLAAICLETDEEFYTSETLQ